VAAGMPLYPPTPLTPFPHPISSSQRVHENLTRINPGQKKEEVEEKVPQKQQELGRKKMKWQLRQAKGNGSGNNVSGSACLTSC